MSLDRSVRIQTSSCRKCIRQQRWALTLLTLFSKFCRHMGKWKELPLFKSSNKSQSLQRRKRRSQRRMIRLLQLLLRKREERGSEKRLKKKLSRNRQRKMRKEEDRLRKKNERNNRKKVKKSLSNSSLHSNHMNQQLLGVQDLRKRRRTSQSNNKKEKLKLLKMELKTMMRKMKTRRSNDKEEILIFRMLRVSLQKRPSRKCKNRMMKIKQINSKKMTMEVESDLETEEERNRRREVLIDQIFIRRSLQLENQLLQEESCLEHMMKKM